jgi:hypothetical protein
VFRATPAINSVARSIPIVGESSEGLWARVDRHRMSDCHTQAFRVGERDGGPVSQKTGDLSFCRRRRDRHRGCPLDRRQSRCERRFRPCARTCPPASHAARFRARPPATQSSRPSRNPHRRPGRDGATSNCLAVRSSIVLAAPTSAWRMVVVASGRTRQERPLPNQFVNVSDRHAAATQRRPRDRGPEPSQGHDRHPTDAREGRRLLSAERAPPWSRNGDARWQAPHSQQARRRTT